MPLNAVTRVSPERAVVTAVGGLVARLLQRLPRAGQDLAGDPRQGEQQREREGKGPMQAYYRDFALLQEVTKAACNLICGEITVAHTSAEIKRLKGTLNKILAFHTGKEVSQIETDSDRDFFMTPPEAVDYGMIDEVLQTKSSHLPYPKMPSLF